VPVIQSLKGDRAFQRLRRGRPGHARFLSLRWRPARSSGVHVGIVVSKKVGKAVTRNRVRRRLKEALKAILKDEIAQPETSAFEMVIIARPDAADADYRQLKGALEQALRKGRVL
jgi:ribonuclease P protein component